MKLSEYAKKIGITYRTAWTWWKAGYLKGQQIPTGTIIVDENQDFENKSKNKNKSKNTG